MVAFVGPLGVTEMIVIAVVAILVFGKNLPEVVGQVAGFVARARRALTDLRRETGIDREIREARRAVESSVPNIGEWKSPSRAIGRRVREAVDLDADLAEEPEAETKEPSAGPESKPTSEPARDGDGSGSVEPPALGSPPPAEDGSDDADAKNAG